jgi:hypothetical protein
MSNLPAGFEIEPTEPSVEGLPPGFEVEQGPMSWSDVGSQAIQNAPASAKTFAAPYLHALESPAGAWWDSVKNVSQLGAGLMQKGAEKAGIDLGTGYEKYADAVGKFYADRYGSIEGVKRAIASDPVGVLGDVASVIAPMASARGLTRAAARAVPSTEELFDAANGAYSRMRNYGIEIHPRAAADVAANIRTELEAEGYAPDIAPKTYSAVDRLENPVGKNSTISDIDIARKRLNRAAADYTERDASRRAVSHIDDFLSNLDPNDVPINPHFAHAVADAASEARGNYAAAKRSELLDETMDKAERRAAATGSGSNIDNVIRQSINSILNSPKKLRGFREDEVAIMQSIARGSTGGNAARLAGKMAPTGIVSAGMDTVLGHATGIPSEAFMGLGFGMKKLADRTTIGQFNRLHEMVRSRSPLAQGMAPVPARAGLPPVAPFLTLPKLGGQYVPNQT